MKSNYFVELEILKDLVSNNCNEESKKKYLEECWVKLTKNLDANSNNTLQEIAKTIDRVFKNLKDLVKALCLAADDSRMPKLGYWAKGLNIKISEAETFLPGYIVSIALKENMATYCNQGIPRGILYNKAG
ncbi:MAG: hypothetical protein ABIG10_02225 [bacterium]